MINCTLKLHDDSHPLILNLNSELKNSQGKNISLKQQIIDQIVRSSNDQVNSFKYLPASLKGLSLLTFFLNSFFSNNVINLSLKEEKLLDFSLLRGFGGLHNQGGLFHDLVNFFPYIGQLKKDWIDDNPNRISTMICGVLTTIYFIYPAILYFSDDFLKKAEYYEKYANTIKSLTMVFQGFFLTLTAVLFGMALNYFVNLILKKTLKQDEYDSMKNQVQYSTTTKKEIYVRCLLAFVGIGVSALIPYLKPRILERISNLNPLYPYASFLFTGIGILLGIQCLSIRILVPIFKKILLKYARKDNGNGRRNKTKICSISVAFYTIAIALFALTAYLDKSPLFSNAILNNLTLASCSGVAIIFNILACQFIFMATMLSVNSRALTTNLLSENHVKQENARKEILVNKIFGGLLLSVATLFVCTIVFILIYSKVKDLNYLDKIFLRPYFAIFLSILLSAMVFIGMALYGKSSIIEYNVGLINKAGGANKIEEYTNNTMNRIHIDKEALELLDEKSKVEIRNISESRDKTLDNKDAQEIKSILPSQLIYNLVGSQLTVNSPLF